MHPFLFYFSVCNLSRVSQKVEFPMASNDFSFELANRQWELLEREGVQRDLFLFDKVLIISIKVASEISFFNVAVQLIAT